MEILIILNDPPYGTELSYNGLRLAKSLLKNEPTLKLTVFLMADAVVCAKRGQNPPKGYYNVELMLKPIIRGGRVLLCGNCLDARGLIEEEIIDGAVRSTMDELAQATLAADKVLVF